MVAVTGDVSLLDNTILNNCHTVIKRSSAYFWIPISEQHQRELAFLWLLPGTTALALGHSLILRDLQHLSSLQHLLVCYWVGQKFHSGFPHTSLWKNPNELFGQPNTLITPLGFGFAFTAYHVSGVIPEFTECLRHFLGIHP